jgi:hypothetical protein
MRLGRLTMQRAINMDVISLYNEVARYVRGIKAIAPPTVHISCKWSIPIPLRK